MIPLGTPEQDTPQNVEPNFTVESQTTPEEFALMEKVANTLGNITLSQVAEVGEPIMITEADETHIVRVEPDRIGYRLSASPREGEAVGSTSEFLEKLDQIKHD